MRMHSPKFKKTIMNDESLTQQAVCLSPTGTAARHTQKLSRTRCRFFTRRTAPQATQPPEAATTPPPAETRSIPTTGTPVACSANRKSRTMQPSIREQPASTGNTSPSHSKQQVKKGAVILGKGETDRNFRRYQPKKPGSLPGGNRGLKENSKTNTAPPKPKTRRQPAPSRMVGRLGTLNIRGYG